MAVGVGGNRGKWHDRFKAVLNASPSNHSFEKVSCQKEINGKKKVYDDVHETCIFHHIKPFCG